MTSIRPMPPPPYSVTQSDVQLSLDKFINGKAVDPYERKQLLSDVLKDFNATRYETAQEASQISPPLPMYYGGESLRAPSPDGRRPPGRFMGPHESQAHYDLHGAALEADAKFADMVEIAQRVVDQYDGALDPSTRAAFTEAMGAFKATKKIMFQASKNSFRDHKALENSSMPTRGPSPLRSPLALPAPRASDN